MVLFALVNHTHCNDRMIALILQGNYIFKYPAFAAIAAGIRAGPCWDRAPLNRDRGIVRTGTSASKKRSINVAGRILRQFLKVLQAQYSENGDSMANLQHFVIDSKASRFTVKAFASGMSAGLGHNPTIAIRDFDGDVCFFPDSLDKAKLTITIRAASLAVEDDMNKEDRRTLERIVNEQILSTSRHPEVYYQSTESKVLKLGEASYAVESIGQLTLNGVTRTQKVTSQVTLGAYNLRATGNFEISQSNFDIAPANVAGGIVDTPGRAKVCLFYLGATGFGGGFARATDSRRQGAC
jgi:polyisoprenoid-binding protein YceI